MRGNFALPAFPESDFRHIFLAPEIAHNLILDEAETERNETYGLRLVGKIEHRHGNAAVSEARFVHQDDGQWMFVITANRFLRNMVRAVVGTLVEVGRHRLSLDGFQQVLQSGSRSDAGESVPGNALFLWDVKY